MAEENKNNNPVVMTPGEASDTLGFDPRRVVVKPATEVKQVEPKITAGEAADNMDSTKKMKSGEEEMEE